MKKCVFTLVALLCTYAPAFSQYCNLAGQTPYSNLQPGITNFKLNTINRTSGNSESASGVLVTTGLTTTLIAGQTYTISISHSEDTQFFQGDRNNLRVWVDYNNNFSYTDAGETVLSVDLQPPATTYSSTFVVPLATTPGTYHLRATAKMSSDAGHTIPTPCNVPPDPIGYHGEMEDYTFVVEAAQSQSPLAAFAITSTTCVKSSVTVTNTSTGNPPPTFSWVATPSAGVTFSPNNTAINPKINFTAGGVYSISCMASNSVSSNTQNKVLSVVNCTYVGVGEEELSEQIRVGPNPAADVLNIRISNEPASCSMWITNNLGESVFRKPEGVSVDVNMRVDVSQLANGIYFLHVNTHGKTKHQQIVIQR